VAVTCGTGIVAGVTAGLIALAGTTTCTDCTNDLSECCHTMTCGNTDGNGKPAGCASGYWAADTKGCLNCVDDGDECCDAPPAQIVPKDPDNSKEMTLDDNQFLILAGLLGAIALFMLILIIKNSKDTRAPASMPYSTTLESADVVKPTVPARAPTPKRSRV
jgi:hypothetical protein